MAGESENASWLHAQATVTIIELAESSGLPLDVLQDLVEGGALQPADPGATDWAFSAQWVVSVRTAARLYHDFELEAPALGVLLSFIERTRQLETEVRHLRAMLSQPRRG
jgi:chaperone modulatory protein CbpM